MVVMRSTQILGHRKIRCDWMSLHCLECSGANPAPFISLACDTTINHRTKRDTLANESAVTLQDTNPLLSVRATICAVVDEKDAVRLKVSKREHGKPA